MITVFTPTFNRRKLLERVYKSLITQTCYDFEWLVIDDGSTDNTSDLINEYIQEDRIKIQYIKKVNGGKHSAHNEALKYAKGDLFLCLDSDDILNNNAIEMIIKNSKKLGVNDCGFIAYKSDMKGNLLSTEFSPAFVAHKGLYALFQEYQISGEFTLVFKTEIVRKFPYPIIENEYFLSESVLYDKLELSGYTFCPLDLILEICEYQNDGLSKNFGKLLYCNPAGYTIFLEQRLQLINSIKTKYRCGISYNAFYRIASIKNHFVRKQINFITIITWFPGQLAAVYYYLKNRK